jgi:hypothetical protein
VVSIMPPEPQSNINPPSDRCRCQHAPNAHEYGVGRCRCGCGWYGSTDEFNRRAIAAAQPGLALRQIRDLARAARRDGGLLDPYEVLRLIPGESAS